MSFFIRKVTLFLTPILFVFLIMEISLRKIPNDYKLKKEYIDNNAQHIETLILGSSHSLRGLNPDFFSTVTYNASYVSQTIDYDKKILLKYESEFKNLQNVILPISYFSLFQKLDETKESWRVKNYKIYFNINEPYSLSSSFEILSNNFKINIKRIYSFYIKNESSVICNPLTGYSSKVNKSNFSIDKSGKKAANRHHALINQSEVLNRKVFSNLTKELKSIASWCRRRDINLILFTPPAHDAYRRHLHSNQLNLTIRTAKNISNSFTNCYYYNLLDSPIFGIEHFYDADHLNAHGAKRLSKFIDERIIEINKKRRL